MKALFADSDLFDISAQAFNPVQDRPAAAGPDVLPVLPVLPVEADSPLLSDPRVILSPYPACYSVEAEAELRRRAAMNIVTWMRSGRPDVPVVQGTRKP